MRPLSALKKIPNYVATFGLPSGLGLFARIERVLPTRSEREDRYAVPGYRDAITLRESVGDHSAFWGCLVLQQYATHKFPQDAYLQAAYRDLVARGRTPLIIDAGANIGMSALWFAHRYPQAKVLAIEPDHDNFRQLQKNCAACADRILPVHGGVWLRDCHLKIENPGGGAQNLRTVEVAEAGADTMRAMTMDALLAEAGADQIFIAKIDIEGGQKALFSDNTDWVGKTHLIVIELDDWQFPWAGTSRPFMRCMSGYDYDYLLDGENLFCFQQLHPAAR